jgi:hypothetical protein
LDPARVESTFMGRRVSEGGTKPGRTRGHN